jgi:hypothetical protein
MVIAKVAEMRTEINALKAALAAETAARERAEKERNSAIVACYTWRDRRNLPSEEIVFALASMCGMSQNDIKSIVFPPAANLDAPPAKDSEHTTHEKGMR